MSSVKDTVDALRIEYKMWQGLLLNCKERPEDCAHFNDVWTLKDVLAHLTSWQEVTIARLVASCLKEDPEYPAWFSGIDPETDEELNRINAVIYEARKNQSLAEIKKEWEQRFSEILIVCPLISEQEFSEPGRYAWMNGAPLLDVLEGTIEHHRDHRDSIKGSKIQ